MYSGPCLYNLEMRVFFFNVQLVLREPTNYNRVIVLDPTKFPKTGADLEILVLYLIN